MPEAAVVDVFEYPTCARPAVVAGSTSPPGLRRGSGEQNGQGGASRADMADGDGYLLCTSRPGAAAIVVPPPSARSARTVPPWASATCCTIARSGPDPAVPRPSAPGRSGRRPSGRSSSAIPGPWSRTVTSPFRPPRRGDLAAPAGSIRRVVEQIPTARSSALGPPRTSDWGGPVVKSTPGLFRFARSTASAATRSRRTSSEAPAGPRRAPARQLGDERRHLASARRGRRAGARARRWIAVVRVRAPRCSFAGWSAACAARARRRRRAGAGRRPTLERVEHRVEAAARRPSSSRPRLRSVGQVPGGHLLRRLGQPAHGASAARYDGPSPAAHADAAITSSTSWSRKRLRSPRASARPDASPGSAGMKRDHADVLDLGVSLARRPAIAARPPRAPRWTGSSRSCPGRRKTSPGCRCTTCGAPPKTSGWGSAPPDLERRDLRDLRAPVH